MEKKINIAELLKDCPQGMELDCLIFEDVTLYSIDTDTENEYPIRIVTKNGYFLDLTKYGTYSNVAEAKCVIFPKNKTTWEGFQRPFKDGDILISGLEDNPFIFKRINGLGNAQCYCAISCFGQLILNNDNWTCIKGCRLATEEEKERLFKILKDNGYRWNSETKILEKLPKFKVGDRIRKEDNNSMVYTINGVYSSMYGVEERDFGISIEEQDEYELVPNKFDITNLKPYESRVLVRGDIYNFWKPAIFGFIKDKIFYLLGGAAYEQCIPYKNNEHLLGTTNDCDEYYKTW